MNHVGIQNTPPSWFVGYFVCKNVSRNTFSSQKAFFVFFSQNVSENVFAVWLANHNEPNSLKLCKFLPWWCITVKQLDQHTRRESHEYNDTNTLKKFFWSFFGWIMDDSLFDFLSSFHHSNALEMRQSSLSSLYVLI